MLLTTDQAAELIGAATRTRVHSILRVCRDHGIAPIKIKGHGNRGQGGQLRLSCGQVVAVLAYHVLARTGLDHECRLALLKHIAALGDEGLEAKLAEGKSFIVKTGTRCVPELWPVEHARLIERERAGMLLQLSLSLEVIDLSPFIEQVFAAARKLAAPTTADREDSQC